jgi:predicted ABC-type sugar transport system permease subunit
MESELVSPVGPVRVVHCGSLTMILCSGALVPVFVTVMSNVALLPLNTAWSAGLLITVIAGRDIGRPEGTT